MKRLLYTSALAALVAAATGGTVEANKGGNGGGNSGGRSGSVGHNGGGARPGGSMGNSGQRPSGNTTQRPSSQASRPTQNGPRNNKPTPFAGNTNHSPNYHKTHGTSFSHGYCYKGNNHNHWSHYCWSNTYGCNCYWCPSSCSYYYWYAPSCCYYPISYVSYAAPTTVCAPPIATAPVCSGPECATVSNYTVPVNVQVAARVQQGQIVPNGGGGPVGGQVGGPPPAP